MQNFRHRPPTPWWLSIPGLAFQGCGTFVLPFVVGFVAALFFEISEVVETLPSLLAFTLVVLFPVSLAQILGVILKSRSELKWWAQQGKLGFERFLDVLYNHIRVVTLRGWSILAGGLFFTVVALGFKWASFGLLAVLGLLMFYLVVGWTIFLSTFLVRTFEVGMSRANAGIHRQMMPAVTQVGSPVEEVFTFRQVPVPWGYFLLVEDPLSPRLKTESRYAVGASARSGETECRGQLRATPRGQFFLGPARIWYQDLLGITCVSVASVATAELKVLPKIRPVEIIEPPRSQRQKPDIVCKPHRFATEDHFRFREYQAGDDTRRIHWRLSLKTGRMQVRQPETKEISTEDVLLILDTYLPSGKLLDAAHGADEILDALVDAFLGIGKELVDRGDRVTMLTAMAGDGPDDVVIESVDGRRGQMARWQDLGARARWQGKFDLPKLLEKAGDKVHGVVVTSRFTAPPPQLTGGQSITWLFIDPAEALGKPDPHWVNQLFALDKGPLETLRNLIQLPHPVGSEDNGLVRRAQAAWRLKTTFEARRILRIVASVRSGRTQREVSARGDAVYRIEKAPNGSIRLRGLQGRQK